MYMYIFFMLYMTCTYLHYYIFSCYYSFRDE